MAKSSGHRLQDQNGLLGNFRPNSIAGQNGDIQLHWVSFDSLTSNRQFYS
jgi:hypothetical protein